jgi:hypothetical protein
MDAFSTYLAILASVLSVYFLVSYGRNRGWWMTLCDAMIASDLKADRPADARKNIVMFAAVALITPQQADSLTAKYFPEVSHE